MTSLRFREIDRDIFETVLDGSKKVETRAASPKFAKLKPGDKVKLICGKDRAQKTIKKIEHFQNIDQLLSKYQPQDINPRITNHQSLIDMYGRFPNYQEKIKKYGLIAIEFEGGR